ncbi:MAG: D-arabinono-1,4-lactone oxidase, partial [Solirubrobacterales bacterium]
RAVAAGGKVRVAGNLHSFSEIVRTGHTLISLDRQQGIVDADTGSGLVRVRAGSSIRRLSAELDELGLALPSLGDIDAQSIAGAIATGTHGTGERHLSVSAQVTAAQLVTAAGQIIEIGESDPIALKAMRVSLGALGVVTELTLQCVPSFRLDRLDIAAPLGETLATLDALAAEFDHFEFFVFPYTTTALQKRINRTGEPARPMHPARRFFNDVVIENAAFGAAVGIGRLIPPTIPPLARAIAKLSGPVHRLERSHDAFSTPRLVKFNELEYAVPRRHLRESVERILAMTERRRYPVSFPIEVRVGHADDDCLLSAAAGRETGYVSVHMHRGMEFEPYFRAVESIMDDYEGRPHWGKINWQTAAKLAPRYTGWDDFQTVRARLDPGAVFTNAYIERVLGPVRGPGACD